MMELEAVNGGVFAPIQQQRSQAESSQTAPVLPPIVMSDGEEGASHRSSHPRLREKSQRKSSGEIAAASSSASGMFSKKRKAADAQLKTHKGSDPKKNRSPDEDEEDNTPQPPQIQ